MLKSCKLDLDFEQICQLEEIMPRVSIVKPKPPVLLLPGSNEAVRNPGGKTISSLLNFSAMFGGDPRNLANSLS